MNNPLEDVIEKYFRDEKTLNFHPADAIFDDQYLRWEYHQHERNKILISIGSNDGEVRVNIFTEADKLEQFIKLAIY
jgi:hypothetical protein